MKKLFQSVSLRFFIKSLGICFITLLWSSLSPLHSQNCTTFENIPLNPNGVNSIPGTGWRVYNWPSTTPPGIAPANFPNQIRIEPGTTGGSTTIQLA